MEQRLRLSEIQRAKPLSEPAVGGGKEIASFAVPALVPAESGEVAAPPISSSPSRTVGDYAEGSII